MKKSQKSERQGLSERLLTEQRIRAAGAFKFIFENAVFVRGIFLKVWIYRDTTQRFPGAGPKIGIIVSRKTHARAVVRNLWKRRIRESFRKMQRQINPECLILVGSRQAQKKMPALAEIEAELHKLLSKTESLK